MPSAWFLSTTVIDSHTGAGATFLDPQPEFHDSHSAMLVASRSATTYDISISDSQASYLIHTEHTCINSAGEKPLCKSEGRITMTPLFDLPVSFDLDYAYRLAGYPTSAIASVGVTDLTSQPQPYRIFSANRIASSGIEPNQGVLSIHDSVVLPAMQTYRITYTMQIDAWTTLPSMTAATGNGTALIRITPEPASFALLLTAAVLLRLRRRRA